MKKIIFNTIIFLVITCLSAGYAFSQAEDGRRQFLMLNFNGGVFLPGGDLSDRFGGNGSIGAGINFKTYSNIVFGAEIDYLFGSDVRETNILDNLRTEDGWIIGFDGLLHAPILNQRGYRVNFGAGYVTPLLQANDNSGIFFKGSVGFLQHKISISDGNGSIPQLSGDYRKGYDRLTNGISFTEFAGYKYISENNLINFLIGIEFTQALTQNRRDFNYDTKERDDRNRLDMLFGIKASWILPFHRPDGRNQYFY